MYHSTLDEMLPLCDFIVVCVSLNPQTKHMFSTKQFQLMKNTAVFSNVSRGNDNLLFANLLISYFYFNYFYLYFNLIL